YLQAVEMWKSCSSLNSASILQGEDTDTLASFLLDCKEGSQLVTVLQLLAALNNSVLAEFCEIQKNRNRPYSPSTPVPLKDLQSSQLLFLSLASFSESDIYLVNPAYGKGVEVVCNYVKLEEAVIERFENSVQIDKEKIDFIQYQFELLSAESQNQHLIEEIRTQHLQREFSPEEKKTASDALTKRKSETSDSHQARLLSHIEQLESLMCLLIRSERVANVTIQQFAKQCSGYTASPLFTTDSALTSLSLELIVAVYEQLEVEFFPYAKQLLSPEFRQEDASLVISLQTVKSEEIPPLKDLVSAVMRLILRMLLAGVECSQPISRYITRADLWEVTVNKEAVEKFVRVLEGRSLGVSLILYEELREMWENAEKLALAAKQVQAVSSKGAAGAGRRNK
ncbi:MAG: hypothetical protein J0651_04220, partial [Actinobacteria bacterium]|nr:hypothetical protein [Actinomycetota bacterium]